MGKEFRRKAPRRDYTGTLGVLHKGRMIMSPAMQVGEGGALFSAKNEVETISVGDSMVVTVFFPRIGGVVARAQCLYRTDSGNVGVSFDEIEIDFKKRIREYVSRRKS